MKDYRCSELNAVAGVRVRGLEDAARVFAHRLARKMFGHSGRCLSIRKVRRWHDGAQFIAEIGRLRGPSTSTPLTVECIRRKES